MIRALPTLEIPTTTIAVPSVTVEVPTATVEVPTPTIAVPSVTVAVPSVTAEVPTTTIAVPSVTVPTPTVAVPTTPTEILPDLAISQLIQGGINRQVGQRLVTKLLFSNAITGSLIGQAGSIVATIIIPTGLEDIKAIGSNWDIKKTSAIGPSVLTATYLGNYPVLPGSILPPITLSGLLNNGAVPAFTLTSTISTLDKDNLTNNAVFNTLSIAPAPTPVPTIIPTPPAPPSVTLDIIDQGVETFQAGQTVINTLLVSTAANAGPVNKVNSIFITNVISTGLKDIQVLGTDWVVKLSSTTSPALLIATYKGA